jgi:Zn finger protein HypA/HybF involved in hydrogenase expression
MHESGVADDILEAVLARAAAANASEITTVELEVGQVPRVSVEALSFWWDQVSRGTPAEGATLIVRPTIDAAADPAALRLVAIEVPDGPPGRGGVARRGAR